MKRNSKPELEIKLEREIRNLRQQAKMILKKMKNAGIYWEEKRKVTQQLVRQYNSRK